MGEDEGGGARKAHEVQGTGSAFYGGACPAVHQTRTASPKQYAEGPRGEPVGRQVRRHRACEVERPLYDPGAKKEYRNEF
jgi:hypothetical protein